MVLGMSRPSIQGFACVYVGHGGIITTVGHIESVVTFPLFLLVDFVREQLSTLETINKYFLTVPL